MRSIASILSGLPMSCGTMIENTGYYTHWDCLEIVSVNMCIPYPEIRQKGPQHDCCFLLHVAYVWRLKPIP